MSVKEKITILIADRNPHVREFLKREMIAEGYDVWIAETGRDVLRLAYQSDSLALLILDPDMPDMPDTDRDYILKKLQNRIPILPMIIHTFISDYTELKESLRMAVFVEKKGNSVERLKEMIFNILNKKDIL